MALHANHTLSVKMSAMVMVPMVMVSMVMMSMVMMTMVMVDNSLQMSACSIAATTNDL